MTDAAPAEPLGPQQVVDFLNSLLELDRRTVEQLFQYRVFCNQALADHPTVQVKPITIDGPPCYRVGFIGLLNGLLGTRGDGYGYLCAVTDETGELLRFALTPGR